MPKLITVNNALSKKKKKEGCHAYPNVESRPRGIYSSRVRVDKSNVAQEGVRQFREWRDLPCSGVRQHWLRMESRLEIAIFFR